MREALHLRRQGHSSAQSGLVLISVLIVLLVPMKCRRFCVTRILTNQELETFDILYKTLTNVARSQINFLLIHSLGIQNSKSIRAAQPVDISGRILSALTALE